MPVLKHTVYCLCILALALSSCNKCKNVPCLNGGACEDGTCICPEGYTGTQCENEDRCYTNNVHCLNGGTCFDGKCDCPEGFSGVNCEINTVPEEEEEEGEEEEITDLNEHTGLYTGVWDCVQSPVIDSVKISTSTIQNTLAFFEEDYGFQYNAEFSANLKDFTIPLQAFGQSPNDYTVEGSGSIINGTLKYSVDYTFPSNPGDNFSCGFEGS